MAVHFSGELLGFAQVAERYLLLPCFGNLQACRVDIDTQVFKQWLGKIKDQVSPIGRLKLIGQKISITTLSDQAETCFQTCRKGFTQRRLSACLIGGKKIIGNSC